MAAIAEKEAAVFCDAHEADGVETLQLSFDEVTAIANLDLKPLRRPACRSLGASSADALDAHFGKLAIDEGDAMPYSEFRKELGIGD